MPNNTSSSSYDLSSSSKSFSIKNVSTGDVPVEASSLSDKVLSFIYQHKFKWLTLLVCLVLATIFHFKYRTIEKSSFPDAVIYNNNRNNELINNAINNLKNVDENVNENLQNMPNNIQMNENINMEESLRQELQEQLRMEMQEKLNIELNEHKEKLQQQMENQLSEYKKEIDNQKPKDDNNKVVEQLDNIEISDDELEDLNIRSQNLTQEEMQVINQQLKNINI